jgi:hypothetical protein
MAVFVTLLLLEDGDFRSRILLSAGRWKKGHIQGSMCKKSYRSELPRRMPYEKNTQVAGTLIPPESLRSNQLVKEAYSTFI